MLSITTADGKFLIRPYQKGDQTDICRLFQEVFGQVKPKELWEWEFLANPYGTEIMVCEHVGRGIVAQCAALPAPFAFNGQIYRCAQLVDCMCKKEYRMYVVKKRGLFALTVQEFFNQFTGENKNIYLYGFPGERHYRLGKLLLGYRKTKPALETRVEKIRTWKGFGVRLIALDSVANYQNQINQLAKQDAKVHPLCLFKEFNYLSWRYVCSPKKYAFFGLTTFFHKLKSLAILKIERDHLKLIDFLGVTQLKKLLFCLWQEFKKPIILGFPQNSYVHKIIKEMGYTPVPVSIPIIPGGKTFWEKLDWDFANNNFFYTLGDCDLF